VVVRPRGVRNANILVAYVFAFLCKTDAHESSNVGTAKMDSPARKFIYNWKVFTRKPI
jgi:hypothetical protein